MKTVLVIVALQFLPTSEPGPMPYEIREVEKRVVLDSREDCEYLRRQYGFTGMGWSYMIVGSYCVQSDETD